MAVTIRRVSNYLSVFTDVIQDMFCKEKCEELLILNIYFKISSVCVYVCVYYKYVQMCV